MENAAVAAAVYLVDLGTAAVAVMGFLQAAAEPGRYFRASSAAWRTQRLIVQSEAMESR